MRYQIRLASLVAGSVLLAALMPSVPAHAEDQIDVNRSVMNAFVDTAYGQKQVRKAYEAYVAADMVQHDPDISDGREAAIVAMERLLKDPAARFEVKHLVVDGDMAAVHFRGSTGGPMSVAVTEMFRLQNGKIVEHWDTFQVMDPKVSAHNAHPYF